MPQIVWHKPNVLRTDRERLNGHRAAVIWFTGLPSSGKSTVAHAVDEKLFKTGVRSYVLDGDNIRHNLNKDLGLTADHRRENIRRIGEVARLFVDAGIIALPAFISPYSGDRDFVRELVGSSEFIEVYVKCPPEVCEQRDPKGHYKKARQGLIREFTGMDAPYEEPLKPEMILETDKLSVKECVDSVMDYLKARSII